MTLFRKNKPSTGANYAESLSVRFVFISVLVFLYAPLFTLIAFSFNDSRRNIVWKGFTTKYYEKAAANTGLIEAFTNSLVIAFITTIVAVILGAMVGMCLWRFRFRFKPLFESVIVLPIVIPEICLGVAMLVFFSRVGWPADLAWPFNLGNIIIAHIMFCFPFVAIIVRARLAGFNNEMEEAARDLGASDWHVVTDILLPYLKPSLIAGGMLAFILSLDDFVITFFTSGPDTITFPVKVYSMVRFSVTPEVNAASTILILITIFLTVLVMQIQSRTQTKIF